MHSTGRSQSKEAVFADLSDTRFSAGLAFSDIQVDIVGDTALATLTVDQVKNLPGGKTRASRIVVMMVWVWTRGGWQLLGRSSHLPAGAAPAADKAGAVTTP